MCTWKIFIEFLISVILRQFSMGLLVVQYHLKWGWDWIIIPFSTYLQDAKEKKCASADESIK